MMTYLESYMKCNTLSELEEEIKHDIIRANLVNPDRLKIIKAAGEKAANLKFNVEIGESEVRE